ncbi:MAG: hypothetical protein ACLR78_10690 [Roseburia sp.]
MDFPFSAIYNNVKNNCKGGKNMRKLYIDNIRWITVVLVVLYHVIYMFNGIETFGVIGPFSDVQYQDAFQYIVYPWFMLLLFVILGMSARYELEHRSEKEFIKKDRKIVGSIHPWAFSVLVDFRILQSADRRWIRADGRQFQNRFYLSSWQSAASDRYGISRCYGFFSTAHMGSQSGKRQIVEAGRESKRSISCAVCNCDLGRSSDFKHTNDCGISLWYLWGWILCGIFHFLTR